MTASITPSIQGAWDGPGFGAKTVGDTLVWDGEKYANESGGSVDLTNYTTVDGAKPFTGPITINRGTVGPPIILGANGQGQLVTGLNADQLDGQHGAYYLARGNHTGTLLAATISDFDTQVRTSRLDQMAAPAANVSLASQRVINLADPSGAQDAATKAYVDALAQGAVWKASVRVATTANITLSGAQTIDGVSVIAGDRVLVKNQSTASQNGIYVCASGSWSRATDADTGAEMRGATVVVEEGTTNADTIWLCTNNATITLGSTSLAFTQIPTVSTYTAGTGLTLTGTQFSLSTPVAINLGGTGQATALAAFNALSPLTTQGDVLYFNGTNNVRLGPGTSGQVLTSGGAGANPSWTTISGGVTDHGALSGLSDDDHSQYLWLTAAKASQVPSPPYNFTPNTAWLRNLVAISADSGGSYYPYTVDAGQNEGASHLLVGVTAAGQDLSSYPPAMGLWYSNFAGIGYWLRGYDSHYITYFGTGGYLSLQSWGREIFHADYNLHTFADTWVASYPTLRLYNTAAATNLLEGYATDGTTKVFALEKTGKICTNQASSNTNTPSGATAKQLPIHDAAGTLLGYVPLYGSAW